MEAASAEGPSRDGKFRLGEWTVEPASGQLRQGDMTRKLEPRVMDLLMALAQRPGEVLSREQLEQEVWSGRVVGYDALSSAIIKLRKALGDDPYQPRYIETISKKGYRLIAQCSDAASSSAPVPEAAGGVQPAAAAASVPFKPVWSLIAVLTFALIIALLFWWLSWQEQAGDEKSPAIPATSGVAAALPSIAVLPFRSSHNGDTAQSWFSDGITEDLITDLSRLSSLRVIARNSVFGFKHSNPEPRDVARMLGARYIVQGSIRRADRQVRINVTFVDGHSGLNLWAARFDGSLDEVFVLQDQVVKKIVTALSLRLSETERAALDRRLTDNLDALQEYFWGRANYGSSTKLENEATRKRYRRAIELDPDFAQAYAALALTHLDDWRRQWSRDREESIRQAFALANKAIAIDPSVPQAYFTLGYIYLYTRDDHDRAIVEARKALALDPNFADGYALLSSAHFFRGEPEKSLPLDRKAMTLNPASSFLYYVHLGRSYYFQGDYRRALRAFRQADTRNHTYVTNHVWLAATHAQLDQPDEAAWEVDQIHILQPDFSLPHWLTTRPFRNSAHRTHLVAGLRKAGLK